MAEAGLKTRTARTLKWNTIDRVSSQALYAIIGVVLANILSKSDFGLIGAIMVFQAFATIFVDSGFGAALLQQKHPTQEDYSTVFWFNLVVSAAAYTLLFFGAPIIARIYQDNEVLIPLSRVLFLTFVLNGLAIVQTNKLTKELNVKPIALSNLCALICGGGLGLYLALTGYGAWALVWMYVTQSAVKTLWLWISTGWRPMMRFSTQSLRKIYRVGLGVFTTSFLNTLFLNIYSFIIGAFYSIKLLGIYYQADKWSKMGSASLSQILTSSFVPVLAGVQDDPDRYRHIMGKINRFTGFMAFPFFGYLTVAAAPIFHTLFGTKWDAAIPLFQILCVRGIFVVLTSLCSNYLLALGYARRMVTVELVKDISTVGAILATVWYGSIDILVWGQFAASFVTYIVVHWITSRATGYGARRFGADFAPYATLTLAVMAVAYTCGMFLSLPPLMLCGELLVGVLLYYAVLRATGSHILNEAQQYLTSRFRRKSPAT